MCEQKVDVQTNTHTKAHVKQSIRAFDTSRIDGKECVDVSSLTLSPIKRGARETKTIFSLCISSDAF